jgi:hypothetical protein
MNAETAKRRATYEDVLAAPAHLVAEIINGVLHTHPRPRSRHASASNAMSYEVTGPFQKGLGGPGGWIFMDEPELHFGSDIVVPDLAGWRRKRLPAHPKTPYLEVAPDWVCEILSPSTATIDRGSKRHIYGAAGVNYMWILDADAMLLEAYALTAEKWLLVGTVEGGERVSLMPFEAISFPLDDLFPLDPPTPPKPELSAGD